MKLLISLLIAFMGATVLVDAQPLNDDCAGLIDLGQVPVCPTDTFSNVDATQSNVFSDPNYNIPACFNSGVVPRDVWFSFTVPPDGSVLDFTVLLQGVGNNALVQPQVAVYRGDCVLDGLQEVACATSDFGDQSLSLHLLGLTPGVTYFLRINDYSASATPNWGNFTLCITQYVPAINMGDVPLVQTCTGTLYDDGGPDGDYSNGQNLSLTICPQDYTECISLHFNTYSIEGGFDALNIFAGPNVGSPQAYTLDGSGSDFDISVNSSCVTLQFTSDGSVTEAGFEMTWSCAPVECDILPIVSCAEPALIPTLPFAMSGLSTCLAGNSVNEGPCNGGGYLSGEDYVFIYESPGQECISVQLSGTLEATGVGIYADCPSAATTCIAQAGGGLGQSNPAINSAFLETPGTYYIVVDNAQACTPFDIVIDYADCPVVFPSAAECEDALSLNGCGDLPAIITVGPGQGDPDFIDPEVNIGCWGTSFPLNYTFFWFEAQADGQFGFTMQAANPAEASDVDFQIWGPIDDIAQACTYALTHAPIRSSYAAGADPTGLADTHPVTGLAVTDTCEGAGGDDFVATLPVQQGEVYLVLVNDWGGNIITGAVAIDFSATTAGVLDAEPLEFTAGPDTVVCLGEPVQLQASGGTFYQWFPAQGLSCVYCPNPVAVVDQTTTYRVAIHSICQVDTLEVTVQMLAVDAGPDRTVCLGEDLQIVAGSEFSGIQYLWQGPAGTLSCTDCPDPTITANEAGTFTYTVTAIGSTCSFTDEMTLTVLPHPAPQFALIADTTICAGDSVALMLSAAAGQNFSWSSVPAGFSSTQPDPVVVPVQSTTYYLTAENGICPIPAYDSVTVQVVAKPEVVLIPDTVVCEGQPLMLALQPSEVDVSYVWSPSWGLSDSTALNTLALPPAGTTKYVLTASRASCTTTDTVNVDVRAIQVDLGLPDTVGHCRMDTLQLSASVFPADVQLEWVFPEPQVWIDTLGTQVILIPQESGWYFAKAMTDECIRFDSVFVGVDSLPQNMAIMPADTLICQGELVVLHSAVYEPAHFANLEFQWLPSFGQQSPDTLYHLVVQPDSTTTYLRIARNGFCVDTAEATVGVQPIVEIEVLPQGAAICPGESIQLEVTTSEPATLTWSPENSLSCSNCPNPVAIPSQTTTYMVNAEVNNCPNSASVTVEVLPQPHWVLPNDPVICLGDQVVLNQAPDTTWMYVWTSSDGTFSTTGPAPVVQPTTTTTYYLQISYPGCSPLQDSVTVFIGEDAVVDAGPDQSVCKGEVVNLMATSNLPQGQYLWLPDSLVGAQITVMPDATIRYTVQLTTPCGIVEDSVWVHLISPFSLDSAVAIPDTVYEGQGFALHGYTTPEVLAGPQYTWIDPAGELLGVTTVPILQVVAPEIEGPQVQMFFTLLVNDQYGCSGEVKIPVVVRETKIDVPNLFTPNGDGVNDQFEVLYTDAIQILDFKVYNRWGQLVYRHGTLPIWDGIINGKQAPADVYIWTLHYRFGGKEEMIKGEVTLMR